ncbi:MAG: hypothetical protein ACJ75J_08055, partial [Cytophagaceae bacterium]
QQVKSSINHHDYKAANDFLKKALALKKALPDEAAYYHGVLLFQQKKYPQAKISFQKYLSLTGASGEYFKEAEDYLKQSDALICPKCNDTGFREITDTCTYCHGKGKVEKMCKTCQGKGFVYCQACGASGVSRHGGGFGGTYQSCSQCKGKGYHNCATCGGKKKNLIFCESCAGKGFRKTKISCDHKTTSAPDHGKLK